MVRHALVLAALGVALSATGASAGTRTLTFQERVEARRAIEKVLWAHRTWPAENGPRPAFEDTLPAGALERAIEDDLRKSDALKRRWNRPVTQEALQAELDRMVRNSQAPDILREMLDALAGDATLAAEVLARHALVDRLTRSAFAYDARIHGDTYARAAVARGRSADILALHGAADQVVAMRYERASTAKGIAHDLAALPVERLDEARWSALAEPLRSRPLGELGPLQEGEREFAVSAVTAKEDGAVTVSTAVWEKRSFDAWWHEARTTYVVDTPDPVDTFTLQPLAPPGSPCTNDTWYPMKRTAPSARMEPVWIWTGAEMFVWGGGSALTGALATGARYRPDIDVWTEINPTGAPPARRHATAVWTGTEMIVWGGDDGASPTPNPMNSGGRYNPVLDAWTPTSAIGAPTPRAYPTSVWTGSVMIVWGGYSVFVGTFQTGGVYDPATNSWTPTSLTNAPFQRYGHTATWLNGEMVVWGGDPGTTTLLDSGGRYNPATDTWVATASSGNPGARAWHSAVVFAGRILIWGGQRTFTTTWNTGAFYVQDGWQAVGMTGAVPPGRLRHTAVVIDQNPMGNIHMVVFGGLQLDPMSGVPFEVGGGGTYRQIQNDWRPMQVAGAPSARHWNAAVSTRSAMVVWGGASGTTAQGDGRIYDPNTETWSGMSSSGTPGTSPGPRTRHTMVWTGPQLLVWGGIQPSGLFALGGASYLPATDSWSGIDETASPRSNYWHTAVWTGSAMLVWGGETNAGTVNTGAYWDGFGWTPMDPIGAPTARRRHSAVWVGSNTMVVWGGEVNFGNPTYNDGGRFFYHPVLGQNWTTPPAAVALGGRVLHSATWTGTRMVVFGGADPTHIWGDGAAYNPVANTWTLLPTTNVPAARYLHTAVNPLDDSVILWGGWGAGNYLADGARYFSGSNTWGPVAAAPLAGRRQIEATWTGREMLVWGGLGNFGALFGDGARYNPGFDGWTPMSTLGAPSPRYDYRSRQAGDEMYVWGGSDNTDTGGRYCASCARLDGFEAAKTLSFGNGTTFVWEANAGATAYAVYRGTVNAGVPLTNHTCFQGGLTSPIGADASLPPAGTGYYYLVGASNGCSRTHLGRMTGGALRTNPACP